MRIFKRVVVLCLLLYVASLEAMDSPGILGIFLGHGVPSESAFSHVVESFIRECSDHNRGSRESRKMLCRSLLQGYLRNYVKVNGVCQALCKQIQGRALGGQQPERFDELDYLCDSMHPEYFLRDTPGYCCSKMQRERPKNFCKAAEYLCARIQSADVHERREAAAYLYDLSLDFLLNNNVKQVQGFALLAMIYWFDEQPKEQVHKAVSNHLRLLCRRGVVYAQDIVLKLSELYKDDVAMKMCALSIVDKKAVLDEAAVAVSSGFPDYEAAFSHVVDAFISELYDRKGMQNQDYRNSRKLLCRALLQRYVRECVKIKGVCEKLCSQIRAKTFKEYTSTQDIDVLRKRAKDVMAIFGEQSVWRKQQEKRAKETVADRARRERHLAEQPSAQYWYDVPEDICLGGHEKYQGGVGVYCGVAEYICNKMNSEQQQDQHEVLEYLYDASLDLLQNNNAKQVKVFALLVVMYWVDEQPKNQAYKVLYNHLRLLRGRGFLYANDVALTLFAYKEDAAMRSCALGIFNDTLLNGYVLNQNLVASELDCCQGRVGDCTTIDYDNVEDKKALLRDVEVLVLADCIDCSSAFSFLQKVVMYELKNCKTLDDEELVLLRVGLTRTLLKGYLRHYEHLSVDELENVCQLMDSEFSSDRCSAAMQLYYLSLQLLRDSNADGEVRQFALLSVFYWLDEQPVLEWHKVFNNHLTLLVSQNDAHGQELALGLFEVCKDMDDMSYSALTLFAELYLGGYRLSESLVKSALDVVRRAVSLSDEERAIEWGLDPSSDGAAGLPANTIKVSPVVLTMLESMVVAGFEPAFYPALMVAKRACVTYRHNPSYKIAGVITLEKYRFQGFSLLKQLVLRHLYKNSIAEIINKSKKASYVKVLSTFEWTGDKKNLNFNVLSPDQIEFHEKCPDVIALRDEIEENLKRG